VVAMDELPPAPRRERLLELLSEALRRRPEDVHLLVATREPDAVRAAIGPAVSIAIGPAGGAVVTDPGGRSWTVQVADTSSLPRLVEAIGEAGRALRP